MLEFLGFIILVIILFWMVSISNRLAVLERKQGSASVLPGEISNSAAKAIPSVGASAAAQAETVFPATLQPSIQPKTETDNTQVTVDWLTGIGVIALFFGMAFFLKYAIDKGWIGQWMRIVIGLSIGSLFIIIGDIWREKYKKYASALTGGGIGIIYFSLYAAYQLYYLIPQAVAFVLLLIVAILGVVLAYRYKSAALAVLSVAGAFLSPMLLYSNVNNQIQLFVYLFLINASALVVLAKHYRIKIMYLILFGTIINYLVWSTNFSTQNNTWPTLVFLFVIFALNIFGLTGLLQLHKKSETLPQDAPENVGVISVMTVIFYATMIYGLLNQHFHSILGIAGLLGSALVFLAYTLVDRLEYEKLNYPLTLAGYMLLFLSAVWQFSGKTQDFMLIFSGLLLIAVGSLMKRKELRIWGFTGLLICLWLVLLSSYDMANYVFILNAKFGLIIWEIVALFLSAWLCGFVDEDKENSQMADLSKIAGSLLLWFGFSWELYIYYRLMYMSNVGNLMLSLWWVGYGAVLMAIGGFSKSAIFKKISIGLFALSILKVFTYDVMALEIGYRVVSFIVLGVILLIVSYSYQRNKEKITKFLD